VLVRAFSIDDNIDVRQVICCRHIKSSLFLFYFYFLYMVPSKKVYNIIPLLFYFHIFIVLSICILLPEVHCEKVLCKKFFFRTYALLKIQKVIFHEIVRNIPSAGGFRCKMRHYELFLKILGTFGIFRTVVIYEYGKF
jgi:hypothetical protein